MLTATATSLRSFCAFGSCWTLANRLKWPGATKAVSEWFPRRESGWAVALFDSGSSGSAALAPTLALWALHEFGSWLHVFICTGALGLLWLVAFRWLYHLPEDHKWITAEERALILGERETGNAAPASASPMSARALLSLRQTWGIVIGRTLTDPVWFFITDWFAIYLVAKGHRLEESLVAFWIPFPAADAGNFVAGGVSSYLIQRGWAMGAARKAVITVSGLGMTLLALTIVSDSFAWMVTCFALSTMTYAALSTMILNLPADVYPSHSVASVNGMSGTGAGIGTIIATYLIGKTVDSSSFEPVLMVAGAAPLLAVLAVVSLVRNDSATEQGIVNGI